ncbi:MAG: serine/threonine protein kinase [Chloroflexi bacterium]|nr:serine/threonine protein kinase [Chloroflexota bacterium]
MPTAPTTHETSLKDKPTLRLGLMAVWAMVVLYTFGVLGSVLSPEFSSMSNISMVQKILRIPSLFQTVIEYGVDILLIVGFSVTAGMLVARRSDDWFALFTSAFLVAFGARITNTANIIAMTDGLEAYGGGLLALGDTGIVLFLMLFPNGRFFPGWVKYAAPVMVATMLGLYVFPAAPFHWTTLGVNVYIAVITFWYVVGFFVFSYRYKCGTLEEKQQMRWVSIGNLAPFLWFVVFQIIPAFIPSLNGESVAAAAFQMASRVMGIFLFLILPLSITISIVQTKLFDIDLIINRSIVYGILTVGLGLAFALLFGLASLIFRRMHQGDQSFMVATVFAVAAGALFQPTRKKLQRFVDRGIYHIQIDYQKTPAEIRDTSETFITGSTLSSYRDLKLIGRGGMAEIYRAVSPTQERNVAIKVLKTALAGEEQFRRRFMREAEVVTRLEHPNIVRVMDYGSEGDAYYIVMELLSGPDLNRMLKDEKRIALPDTVNLLRGVADALDYAHQNGLVHRDVKPSNVMMDSSTSPRRVVLTDFGIAKISDAHTRITNTGMVGTFDYIAPEQIQASAEVDGRADIYALGVMAYQMLTGTLPFERPNTGALLLAHLNSPAPDARELVRDLPRSIAHSLQRAMAKEPKDRFATAGEFVSALAGA